MNAVDFFFLILRIWGRGVHRFVIYFIYEIQQIIHIHIYTCNYILLEVKNL